MEEVFQAWLVWNPKRPEFGGEHHQPQENWTRWIRYIGFKQFQCSPPHMDFSPVRNQRLEELQARLLERHPITLAFQKKIAI